MIPDTLASLEIEIEDFVAIRSLAGPPWRRQSGLQSNDGNPHQVPVQFHVEIQVPGIVLDLVLGVLVNAQQAVVEDHDLGRVAAAGMSTDTSEGARES